MARTESNAEVIVAGGGVIGAAMALDLQQRGFDVRLLERGPAPEPWSAGQWDPRVYAVSPASAAYLHSLGVWQAVSSRRVQAYAHMRVWESLGSAELAFDAAEVGAQQLGWIIEHRLLLDQLWHRLGASAKTGVEVAEIDRTDRCIAVRDTAGHEYVAKLLIAADGGRSHIRELMQMPAQGWSYEQLGIVTTVRTERPHENTAWQRFLSTGPVAFLPLSDGRCSIVWSVERGWAEQLLALGDEAFCTALTEASQACLGAVVDAEPRLSFPLRFAHARDYVSERVALIGDAAHVIHPMAGQGANLGWADAQALGQLLSTARPERKFGLRTLRRYERQRQAANLEMLAVTEGLHRLYGQSVPALQAIRNLGLGWVNDWAAIKRKLTHQALGLVG